MNEPGGAPGGAAGVPPSGTIPARTGTPCAAAAWAAVAYAISTRMLPTAGPPAAMYGGMPERRIPE